VSSRTHSPERTATPLFDLCDAVAVALRLALGTPRFEDRAADWSLVFNAASRELLTALAWSRSGMFIRRSATPAVTNAWRRAALATQLRGENQLELLRSVLQALDFAGVDAVVLKGLPLGDRLYGDAFVRCSADIDLYVPAHQRNRAAVVLRALDWRREDGHAPWHEAWSARRGDVTYHLELHSSLVSDHLAHLSAPAPAVVASCIGGAVVHAHTGDFVAAYLAVHLATHQMPPLLWLVDFATYWASLSVAERSRAEDAAERAGVAGYLGWARERAVLMERSSMGHRDALGALGVSADQRRDVHSIWRHLALAKSTFDRVRVLAAFLVPRRVRRNVRTLAAYTIARLRTRLRSLAGASRSYGASSPDPVVESLRPLRLDRSAMIGIAQDVVGVGSALRVRAPGGSMMPTIPRGALIRIGPVPVSGIARGDVVLALTADGEPVIHRVVSVSADRVVMRGDASITIDPAIPLTRVIGVATHVSDGESERALGRRPRRSLAVSALKLRRRIARVVRRDR